MFRFALLLAAAFVLWAGLALRNAGGPRIAPPGPAADNVIRFPAEPPRVSFSVHVADPDGKIALPTPPDIGEGYDGAEGIWVVRIDGVEHFHIASVSSQADGMGNSDLDTDTQFRLSPTLTARQLTALRWLDANKIDLGQDAVTWHYTFGHAFNDLWIEPGWPSAFAQADIIKSLMLAARRSGDEQYLALARRAAYAFGVPCEQGGVRCVVDGMPWFEEIPVPAGHAPMVLNGHLYSVVMLHRLWQTTGDARVKAAYEEGLASAKAMLLRYDTGNWSAYQQRPRMTDITLVIGPGGEDTELREVTATSPFTAPSTIRFGASPYATWPGNGAGGLTAGTATGAIAKGSATITLLPGPPTTTRDLAMSPGFSVSVRYTAPDCGTLWIAGVDWRASEHVRRITIPVSTRRDGDECIATARLPNAINQWSTVIPYYHGWHTRLVEELWRISAEPLFYATAVRWRQYAAAYERDEAAAVKGVESRLFEAQPQPNPADDAAILAALNGAEPASLTRPMIRAAIHEWAGQHDAPPGREQALFARAGVADEAG